MARPTIYDWDEWFTKGRFTVRQGADYRCSQSAMSQQIRSAAVKRGLYVRLIDDDERITVCVYRSRINKIRKRNLCR